jgi:cytochrome c5
MKAVVALSAALAAGGLNQTAAAADGKTVYGQTCSACHASGVQKAPKIGDKNDWAPRIKQGLAALVQSATKGKGAMPPKGGDASLTEVELARAVTFMANSAGAGFKEPAAAPAEKKKKSK